MQIPFARGPRHTPPGEANDVVHGNYTPSRNGMVHTKLFPDIFFGGEINKLFKHKLYDNLSTSPFAASLQEEGGEEHEEDANLNM